MRFEIKALQLSVELAVVGVYVECGRAEFDFQFPNGMVPELFWHVPNLFTVTFERSDSPHYVDIRRDTESWVWATTEDGWRELSIPGYSFRFKRRHETPAQRLTDLEYLADIKIERKYEDRIEQAETEEERNALWAEMRSTQADNRILRRAS